MAFIVPEEKIPIVEAAKAVIDRVFSDTSVTEDETLRRLQELREHIEIMMNTIK